MRNPLSVNWKHRLGRPQFVPKPHRVPFLTTPGLDGLAAWLRKLRRALMDQSPPI